MKNCLISALALVAVGMSLVLFSPPANATPCTYGAFTNPVTHFTTYYWFHEGQYMGYSFTPSLPPPGCEPH